MVKSLYGKARNIVNAERSIVRGTLLSAFDRYRASESLNDVLSTFRKNFLIVLSIIL